MALCIDLFCGLGGWTEGFLAEGWNVIGFDNHRHEYGEARYPAQLVIQDVLTLHGSQFRNAHCIVASPPCQRYSWMAMPWSLAKREASWQRWQRDSAFSPGFDLNDLFNACFRIQREASEAAGRHIPMVVENVKGAQPWVGQAKAHFGSYYLWGDVESVGGRIVCGLRPRFGETIQAAKGGVKCGGSAGDDWFAHHNRDEFMVRANANKQPVWFNDDKRGEKCGGAWFSVGNDRSLMRNHSSKSPARKAASAEIAKIPFPLSQWIAQVMKPKIPPSPRPGFSRETAFSSF